MLHVTKAITIMQPADTVYRYWRDFSNLPNFMAHVQSVATTGDRPFALGRVGPAGQSVEWDAEIVEDRPGELIAWRSLEGATFANEGSVRFERAPGERGTEVHVELRYDPPAGRLGAAVAKLFGEEPGQQIGDDLRRFKQVMETGEVVRSDGSLEGAGQGMLQQRPLAGARDGGAAMKATLLDGQAATSRCEEVPDPQILNQRDAIVRITSDGDLRLGPAPLQRLHADDEEGRHPRPRVHGRSRRGRARRSRT